VGSRFDDLNFLVDECAEFIERIVISSYYHGFEDLTFYSREEMTQDVKKKIRYAISKLPGTHIVSENKKKIVMKVAIKEFNLDIFQIFYRMSLMIDASIESLITGLDWDEIQLNEKEVDKLYNLSKKILTASIGNRDVLKTSKIEKPELVPPLLLINKRLENIADNLKKIGTLVENDSIVLKESKEIFPKLRKELERSVLYLIGKKNKVFVKISAEDEKNLYSEMDAISNGAVKHLVKWIFRYIVDVQKECIDVGFCFKLK
jgi:phosphate uptake regulator